MKNNFVVRISRRLAVSLLLFAAFAAHGTGARPPLAAPGPAQDRPPCATNPDSRQLDFWVGEWAVTFPGTPSIASSKVELSLDKCLVVESWDGGKGHSGENLFAYSADDKAWHGMFTDNRGRVHVLEGKVTPGSAEFIGPNRGPNGEAVLNKVRIVRIAKDKVEESWEKSTDNGATWTTEFRGEYSRKN